MLSYSTLCKTAFLVKLVKICLSLFFIQWQFSNPVLTLLLYKLYTRSVFFFFFFFEENERKEYIWLTIINLLRIHSQFQNFGIKALLLLLLLSPFEAYCIHVISFKFNVLTFNIPTKRNDKAKIQFCKQQEQNLLIYSVFKNICENYYLRERRWLYLAGSYQMHGHYRDLILLDFSQDHLFETFMISRRCNLQGMLQFQFGAKCTMLSLLTHSCRRLQFQFQTVCTNCFHIHFSFIIQFIFLLLCTLIGNPCNAQKNLIKNIYTYNMCLINKY